MDEEMAIAEPETADVDSEISTSEPELTSSDPNIATSAPKLTTSGPKIATSGPKIATSGPKIANAEQEIFTTEPEIATAEPEIATAEPEIASSEPEKDTAEPDIATAGSENQTEKLEGERDSVTIHFEEGEGQETLQIEVIKEKENLFGDNYELFDELSPHDKLWGNRDFRKKIGSLGPDIFQRPKLAAKVEPFKLQWAYGFNRDATIINLCHSTNDKILFFNVTQCGALYDIKHKKMNFLQGHPNEVVAISSTFDGKFVASADSGPDNIIIVWNRSDVSPAMIYFDPYEGHKVLNIALSGFGNYLVSVGECGDEDIRIDFRIWTDGKDEPDGSAFMKNYFGKVLQIKFSLNKEFHFAILFERAVAFLTWDPDKNTLSEPTIPMIKYKGKLGSLTDITYIEKCHEVMVSTTEGCIIFFSSTLYYQVYNEAEVSNDMLTVKICKISKVSVNTIDSADGVVVTGDDKGVVNLFDRRLRLIFWYNNYLGKSIYSIRFDMRPRKYLLSRLCLNEVVSFSIDEMDSTDDLFEDRSEKYEIIYKDQLRKDASPLKERWVIRDFIVVQNEAVTFVDFVKGSHTVIYERGHDYVGAITIHDEFTYMVIGYKNGSICLLDYMNHFLHVTQTLPIALDEEEKPATITCIEYSPKSLYLACGRSNGEVWFLDPILLTPRQDVVNISNYPIEKMVFSGDSNQLAFCNSRMTVYLMIYEATESSWVFIGKTRSHYKNISEMFFFKSDPKNLTTVGMDRYLIVYNNIDIQLGDEFQATMKVRIDQTAIPLACEVYPSVHCRSQFRYLVIADDQFKYKLLNESSQMCRFVGLGPAYGCYEDTPVVKIKILPEHNDDYMVFMTKRHFGLQKLPLTGNPYSFVGCFGHPEELMDFQVSGDGDYVFTVGKNDTTVLRWKTESRGVELMQNLGGLDFEPLYCVIEGGKNGFLFQEMQDLFFYMQILHEGENSTLPRRVSDRLSVTELPDLMRACGFYPTDFEIETFMVDIKYRDFDVDGSIREFITFLDFVKLYVNHKPVYGYSLTALDTTFDTFIQGVEEPIPGLVKREDFLELVTEEGEPFTLSQINKCMEILLGAQGASEGGHYLFDFIPEDIDYDVFVNDILGIDMDRVKIDVQDPETKSEGESSTSTLKEDV